LSEVPFSTSRSGARRTTVRVVGAAIAGATLAACGPGLEALHEGNIRFEHCYRLDTDSRIAPTHREYCWRDWTETYAYGQPLDRVEYARRRIVSLESGDDELITIVHRHAQERVFAEVGAGTAPDAPMAAPAPTSAHEPPPKTVPVPKPATPDPAPAASDLPGAACGSECDNSLTECEKVCDGKQADCNTCREDYRHCMRRCFE
jgi:hypothetical protein